MKSMLRTILLAAPVLLVAGTSQAQDAPRDVTLGPDARRDLAITVYNGGYAQVRDMRAVNLRRGETRLLFADVSAQIEPETALLKGGNFTLIEQNFDFDLLTPAKLLEKAVGQRVRLYRANPTTGVDTVEEALVLSANDGAVLQIGDRIEVLRPDGLPGRVVFDRIPENLRARPTLSTLVSANRRVEGDVELAYLTQGLAWRADYVGDLNADATRLDIQAWITLTNSSGTGYDNAELKVLAGEVNRARQIDIARSVAPQTAAMVQEAAAVREAIGDYHLYTVPHRTTIANNQTKQVALFSASGVRSTREYRFQGFGQHEVEAQAVEVLLHVDNREDAGLGQPLPAGTFRIYTADSQGNAQFIGEDSISNTPEGEELELSLGRAFDVTVTRTPGPYRPESGRPPVWRSGSFTVRINNAKEQAVTVNYANYFCSAEWEIISGPGEYTAESGRAAVWPIEVAAKSDREFEISYRERC